MQPDRIEALIRLVGQTGITQLDVTDGDFSLSITANGTGADKPAPDTAPPAVSASDSQFPAPLSGSFFIAPGPGEPAFIEEGGSFEAGQTLCIIEAMKALNAVTAPKSGRLLRRLVQDGDTVDLDQPLFDIEWGA